MLGPYTVLGADVVVKADADLERVVVHDHVYIGEACRAARRGRRAVERPPRTASRFEEGVVLGDECFVGEHAVVDPGVKVYPFKTVEAGAVVNSSIVWESRGARTLFGRRGVRGLANVDITPGARDRGWPWPTAPRCKKGARSSRAATRAARPGCSSGR